MMGRLEHLARLVTSRRQSQPRNRYAVPGICIALLLAVAIVFGQTVNFGFVNYDDGLYVYDNPHVAAGLTSQGTTWAFTHNHARNWHPLTWISHMVDVQFFGMNPAGHHLTNVILHAATALTLFLLLLRMTGEMWPSALAAALFAVHPLRVQSVAWVAERKDVLSGLLFVLTLAAYVRYARHPFAYGRYLTVLVLLALGLMAKPMLVTVPFVLLLLDGWPLGRLNPPPPDQPGESVGNHRASRSSRWRARIGEKLPMLGLAVACGVATLWAQSDTIREAVHVPLLARVENAIVAYVAYLGQFFYPAGLSPFYPQPPGGPPAWQVFGAILVLAAISFAAIAWRRNRPYLLVGWLWFLGMLVPVIGLIQVGWQSMADRYTYLTQIGLAVALAWGAADLSRSWPHRKWLCGAGATLVLGVLMGRAWQETLYWRDSQTLWSHAVAVNPGNEVANHNLADTLFEQGKIDEAVAYYRKALEIEPRYVLAHYNLANVLARQGKNDEAAAHYRDALKTDPDYAMAHSNLGVILMQQGKLGEAITQFEKAVELEPDNFGPRYNLAAALAEQGNNAAAIPHFRKALELDPKFVEAYNNLGRALTAEGKAAEAIALYEAALAIDPADARAHTNWANALCRLGQFDEAIRHYQKALELKPHFAEAHFNLGNALDGQGNTAQAVMHWREAARLWPNHVEVLQRLAWTLATSPDASIRNGPKAVELADRGVQLSGGRDPAQLDALAAAYAETGQFPRAVQIGSQSLNLAVSQGNHALAAALRQRIGRYRAGVPYRETGVNP